MTECCTIRGCRSFDAGQASRLDLVVGQASRPEPAVGQASRPDLVVGHASRPDLVVGHASRPEPAANAGIGQPIIFRGGKTPKRARKSKIDFRCQASSGPATGRNHD
jgi:hypothetical protein